MTDLKEQAIRDADVIASFLGNESIKRVFVAWDAVLWRRWKEAPSPAEREELHAEARAFDHLAECLRAVVATGERDKHELELDERANATDLV